MPTVQLAPPSLVLRLIIFMIGMFAFLQVYAIQAVLPVLMHDLSATEVQAGLSVGMTVMAIALMSPFMGMLSDAFGRKALIVGALFALAIPTALAGLADHIHALNAWRFLQGLFIPGITVVTLAYISEEYPDALAGMMSFYVAGTVMGGFMGRFLLGYLHTWVGWRSGFLIMAGLILIGAVLVLKLLPPSKKFIKNPNVKSALQTLIKHTKNRHVITACALGACVLFSLVACFTFINLHLAKAPYSLSSAALANIFSVYLIGMVITPLSARLITKVGLHAAILLAVSASMTGLLMTLGAPLWLIISGLTVMSSGVFITQTATISYISSSVSEGRSLASGLYYMSYYAGGSIGAWAAGLAYQAGAWTAVVALILAVQLLALAIVKVFIKKPASA